ncbi:hypothetical protein [Bacillus tequilensis]|uniref:hypothetical protein n=1 Tax=Bacillus tequilensis TaxID=227866 RepID=UPI003D79E92D
MMAKLEGVKTLDMVNGEITKVAYGGAEYERVEGEAKAGDIGLRIDKPTSYATVVAFYQFVYDLGGLSFIDDVGDKPYVAGNHFAIFRKVDAATNPSVEERVAKAEGEIESLKTDVAALKGEAEYKRIAKSEARAGDKVSAASVEADPKSEQLEVGDYAKVVQERHRQNGEIIILRDSGSEKFPFQSERLDGTLGDIFGHRHLVRATDEEVTEAKRAAAEAAERKKWAEIGREVGEYKVGDIFRRNYDGNLFEIARIDDRLQYPIRFTDLAGDENGYKYEANLTLVTPVEARFDR